MKRTINGKVYEEHRLNCPKCGGLMILRAGNPAWKPGVFYGCIRYPACRSSHGSHADGTPLGIPADDETKEWRIKAHAAFDPIWKGARDKSAARTAAYDWMASAMEMTVSEAHIGRFSAADCKRLIELLKREGLCEAEAAPLDRANADRSPEDRPLLR